MSATLIIAQPTTFMEMRTVLKTVERTRTVERTETTTETVPVTGGNWVQVVDSSSARVRRCWVVVLWCCEKE